jgi:uncharacterized protein (DUF1810 family)
VTGLARFVAAQDAVWATVVAELAAGRKRSHWMWFVFPQLKSLGRSATALHYGIDGRAEAKAYFVHPTLGPRLVEGARLVLTHPELDVHAIFGSPDDLKLRSSMTLFRAVASDEPAFDDVLRVFYRGRPDPATLELLAADAD